jgi:hypothetical protein
MTEVTQNTTPEEAPWDAARRHARELEKALLECTYREGSCNGDWSEKSIQWRALHDLASRIVTGLGGN